jgi:3-oxoacyl-[acyl-carrier protein] reductase
LFVFFIKIKEIMIMNENKKILEGKVAVITGAGRGIGKAIALAYARSGAAISCASRTGLEIENTVKEIIDLGGKSLAIKTDVTNIEEVKNLFEETAKRFGGIDILVINAGITYGGGSVEESDPEKWEEVIRTNLIGAYYCAKYAISYLKERGAGKIITVGCGIGHNGMKKGSAVACSKAGLWMLTRVLAQELWANNISVNELIPGPVRTAFNPKGLPKVASEWFKEPEDVVPLALFLATQPDIGPTAQSYSLCRREI